MVLRVFAFFVLLIVPSAVVAQSEETVNVGNVRTIQSQVLKESRKIYIYLPESYPESHGYRRYPVLYIRDGEKFFHSFTGAVRQLTSDATPHAPEMIVVGIIENDRVRDSSSTHSLRGFTGKDEDDFRTSGGGKAFLKFLNDELLPYIDREFSTSSYRIYCGYSFTGLSVIDELFAAKTNFNAFLLIDPSWWWDDYAMEKQSEIALTDKKFNKIRLFMAAAGESYSEKYFIKAKDVSVLAGMLEKKKPSGLDWRFERYNDESHHSMPLRALYDGLSYIFRGYKPTIRELYDEPERLRTRYEMLSKILGVPVTPREDLLNFFGYQFLYKFKEIDKAMLYFQMNAKYYPGSWNAWDSLGEAYSVKGDKEMALRMYEKSLMLNAKNENARKMLVVLREK